MLNRAPSLTPIGLVLSTSLVGTAMLSADQESPFAPAPADGDARRVATQDALGTTRPIRLQPLRVPIPDGAFQMGVRPRRGQSDDAAPRHRVELTGFEMTRTAS